MGYVFPNIKREIYSKTFLKDVRIKFGFCDCHQVPDLTSFFAREFQLKSKIDGNFSGVIINSNNSLVKFEFTPNCCSVRVRYPAYRSFESILQWVPKLNKFLSVLGVSSLKSLSICKYNELEYEMPNGIDAELKILIHNVFSDEICKIHHKQIQKAGANFNTVSRWEVCGDIKGGDEWNSSFRYEMGYSRKSTDLNKGLLTLRTTLEAINPIVLPIDNVLWEFNSVLDAGFQWIIRKEIIDRMK